MKDLQKEFAPYELALRMKALGFDEPCFAVFNDSKQFRINSESRNWNDNHKNGDTISSPLYQQAFRWFREKFEWQHSIEPTADQYNHTLGYNYWIWNYKTGEEHYTMPKNRPTGDWEYETYEEAELACLEKLIELIENK